jgi:hypothetical protein
MDKLNDQELEQMRQMSVGQLLDLFDPPSPREKISEEEWHLRRKVLRLILEYARTFYDDYDCYDYEFALTIAECVIEGDSTEEVIRSMSGLAHYMLMPYDEFGVVSESRDLTADERARLERIRDTNPDFASEKQ